MFRGYISIVTQLLVPMPSHAPTPTHIWLVGAVLALRFRALILIRAVGPEAVSNWKLFPEVGTAQQGEWPCRQLNNK